MLSPQQNSYGRTSGARYTITGNVSHIGGRDRSSSPLPDIRTTKNNKGSSLDLQNADREHKRQDEVEESGKTLMPPRRGRNLGPEERRQLDYSLWKFGLDLSSHSNSQPLGMNTARFSLCITLTKSHSSAFSLILHSSHCRRVFLSILVCIPTFLRKG